MEIGMVIEGLSEKSERVFDTMADEHEIRKIVRKSYAKVVKEGRGCCGPNSSCCSGATTAEQINAKVGYSTGETVLSRMARSRSRLLEPACPCGDS